jgi:hypothetical protein
MSDIPKILLQAAELDGCLDELLELAEQDFRSEELPVEKLGCMRETKRLAC